MSERIERPERTAEIARRFESDGYYFPIDVLSADEAASCRQELEALEVACRGNRLGNKKQLNYAHVIFRFADAIVRQPRLLDAVEAILGPDILVWGSTFFIKEPHSESYISWHQDLRYWGLDSDAELQLHRGHPVLAQDQGQVLINGEAVRIDSPRQTPSE